MKLYGNLQVHDCMSGTFAEIILLKLGLLFAESSKRILSMTMTFG
jgi:hypothetical protein